MTGHIYSGINVSQYLTMQLDTGGQGTFHQGFFYAKYKSDAKIFVCDSIFNHKTDMNFCMYHDIT